MQKTVKIIYDIFYSYSVVDQQKICNYFHNHLSQAVLKPPKHEVLLPPLLLTSK